MVTSCITRQLTRLLLTLGTAGSLLLLFVALIGATATAQAAATVIRVPDDYSDVSFLQNQAALHGQGAGGGLYVEAGSGLRIDGAVFEKNGSIVFPYQFEGGQSGGGGIPPAPPVDIEGTPRPFGARVDIGAYEWHGPQTFMPLISRPACPTLNYVGWAVGQIRQGELITE